MKSLVRPSRPWNTTNDYAQIVTTNFPSSIPRRRIINDDSEDDVYEPTKETSKNSDDEVEFVRSRTVEERNAEGFKNAIVVDE